MGLVGNALLNSWNPDGNFIVGLHRAANSLAGLEKLTGLAQPEGVWFAGECDLKWFADGNQMIPYFYHGTLFPPGVKLPIFPDDVIRSGKELNRQESKGNVLLVEEAVHRFPNALYMIQIKSGVGGMARALDKVGSLFEDAGAKDYFFFSTSLQSVARAKRVLPHIPAGSIHELGLVHTPNYDTTTTLREKIGPFREYSGVCRSDWPSDFFIARPSTKEKVDELGRGYMGFRIKASRDLTYLRESGAMGAFMLEEPERFTHLLGD